MVDVYTIEQTISSGGRFDGTLPTTTPTYNATTGVLTYPPDATGGLFDFTAIPGGVFTGEERDVKQFNLDMNGLQGSDEWEFKFGNGAPILWQKNDAGVYVWLQDTDGQLVLASNEELYLENASASTAALTAAVKAEIYGNVIEALKVLRFGNVSMEFIEATVDDPVRKVKANVAIDHEIIKYKRDSDTDWSSPIATYYRYYWYDTLGETNPIRVAEDG